MQKCKCKWCGDEFLGGPTRIRAHHVKPTVELGQADKKYKICTSKANDRRRNRLSKDRAEKLVRLHYNLRIINKLKNTEWEGEMHAPLQLDDSAGGV